MQRKEIALEGFFLAYIRVMLTHTLKILFHDSRPCYENEEISKEHCSCDFGNPSGHTSTGTVMMFWFFYEFGFKNRPLYLKIISSFMFLVCSALMGTSRIYHGAHFFD